jgi:hypothetical protein
MLSEEFHNVLEFFVSDHVDYVCTILSKIKTRVLILKEITDQGLGIMRHLAESKWKAITYSQDREYMIEVWQRSRGSWIKDTWSEGPGIQSVINY